MARYYLNTQFGIGRYCKYKCTPIEKAPIDHSSVYRICPLFSLCLVWEIVLDNLRQKNYVY